MTTTQQTRAEVQEWVPDKCISRLREAFGHWQITRISDEVRFALPYTDSMTNISSIFSEYKDA